MNTTEEMNERVLRLTSRYLNDCPGAVTAQDVDSLTALGLSPEDAFALLVCSLCGVDASGTSEEKRLYHDWFRPMCRVLEAAAFAQDPYLRAIRFPTQAVGRWQLRMQQYTPYEGFVCGDLRALPDGRVLPQLGCFPEPFAYPAVLEGGREWMTVTPNEIATIRPVAQEVSGRVVTLGLGLGYFAFLALSREEVTALTVVERSAEVISLFRQALLPQFPHPEKLHIVQADAFDWLAQTFPAERPDWLFADLWHDVSDGLPLWERLRTFERFSPGTRFRYWIEDTLRIYNNS